MSAPTTQIEPPLRGETFSVEHLAAHAAQLAARHQTSNRRHDDRRFIERFENNRRFIAASYQNIAAAVRRGESITSTAEWVIDNYHIVEEQLREIREDLPQQYYRELPKLDAGDWAEFPRVYELAHELVVHTDSSLNQDLIVSFVDAYQRTIPLTTGEIWAVPIMLRLVLVENLRRLCAHVLASRDLRDQAEVTTRRWLAEQSTNQLSTRASLSLPDSPTLIVHLLDCLHESNPERAGVRLEDVAKQFGLPHEAIDDLVRQEQQRQAADQVSIGNIITSMQVLSGLDWKDFFEHVSLVEQTLRQDPAHVYHDMDFATRDQYRHVVEAIAKRCRINETDVASTTVALAHGAESREDTDLRRRHIGYYLIDEGRFELESVLGYRPRLHERAIRLVKRHPEVFYLGSIWISTLAGAAAIARIVEAQGATGAVVWLVGLAALLPASELAVALINAVVTHLLRPQALPKLELVDRIPNRLQTLVAIPTMLTSEKALRAQIDRLEIHYLANPEPGLKFVLLTDFADAAQETTPGDAALLSQARAAIEVLNARHNEDAGDRFLLLHRARRWNPMQKVWMGWERKRGKLLELNRLLRGARDTSYLDVDKAVEQLSGVKFVITLDGDTRLPHGVAKRLIGTIAHPLNRAQFDTARRRVVHGFGILQPRVNVSLASVSRSLFAKYCANSPGLDPYCTAVSDVYQDLFAEGSYTGKGIYDVDAFVAAVDGTFPENHILSHDLIEGSYARVGLVTDIELFDDFPARYDADARRQHRWVRGDWQLLPWLFPWAPTPTGRQPNRLTLLSRWKLFDNLRRSLIAPTICGGLLAIWLLQPHLAVVETLAALFVLAAPLWVQSFSIALSWPSDVSWRRHVRDVLWDLSRTAVQCSFVVIFLPYRAWLMFDAVFRTLFRLFVSHRHLLEWETADAAERRLKTDRWSSLREMGWVSVLSVLMLAALPKAAYPAAAPILIAWFFSPVIGHLISRPLKTTVHELNAEDRLFLRGIARTTWAFFEEFVTARENWLPPDNYQEYPRDKIAHRVSPTNSGLYIVSALAARDFGYCGIASLVEMLERNLATLEKLDRHRGHFLNWYDTETLEPLTPRYASTADSGNLAASLIVAARGARDVCQGPLLAEHVTHGLQDAIAMVEESLRRFQPRGARLGGDSLKAFESCLADLRTTVDSVPDDLPGWRQMIGRLRQLSQSLDATFAQFQSAIGLRIDGLPKKVQLLSSQLGAIDGDAAAFLPWLTLEDAATSADGPRDATPWPALPQGTNVDDADSRAAWDGLWQELSGRLSISQLAKFPEWGAPRIQAIRKSLAAGTAAAADSFSQFDAFVAALEKAAGQAAAHQERLERLGSRYLALALEMDFTLTYNPQRRLFSVGFNLDESRADRAHYDLLASEARLASLVAIAKGDVDHRHWFQLGRTLTESEGTKCLLSWGGTMFEFLMPTLFARDFPDSLLDQSCRAAVRRQIAYGRQCGVPWGISESAFSAQAANSDYHYQSFGVPGLGLKRGLAKDLVISPYSTALAAMLDPVAAAANLRTLEADGAVGEWGYYDAVDYTPSRVPEGERRVVVYNYMAHHHGMTLAALANCLLDHRIQKRFLEQPLIRSVELLLQEKVPVAVLEFQPQADEAVAAPRLAESLEPVSRRITTAFTAAPHAHLLSNGQYTVLLTNAGCGFSNCRDLAISRWQPDVTCDNGGQFIYLRHVETGAVWSAGHLPTGHAADDYEVTYSIDKAEIRRLDGHIETHLEVAVSPENNVEVRQVTIRNHGARPVTMEVTSYVEIVLAPAAADLAHPAFSKLFVETEWLPDHHALVARRRPREAGQQPVWAVHVAALRVPAESAIEYETDRARFLGRARSTASPAALDRGAKLSGTTGPVLDPIFSLRQCLHIAPDESQTIAFSTAFAQTREEALSLADQFHESRVVQRTFELAWANSQIELHRLKASPSSVQLYQRLASAVAFPELAWRAPADVLQSNRRGQSSLWRYGISGDDPIVLLRVSEPDHKNLLRELLLAHRFWHAHAFKADLIVLNEHPAGYFDAFHEQLLDLIQSTSHYPINKPGGVYLVRGAHIQPEDQVLLQAAAVVCLAGDRGSLAKQIDAAAARRPRNEPAVAPRTRPAVAQIPAVRETSSPSADASAVPTRDLQFANQYGGFAPDGRSYVVHVENGQALPAPWSNCIANERFGFLVTDSGSGYTWAGNSRENKLTSWSNDPVLDPPAEVVYLRDEQTGQVWTPTPKPIRDSGPYDAEHGHGFSRFTHSAYEIETELLLSIAAQDSVKFACLKLRNAGGRLRQLSIVYFAEWVLGVSRERSQMHVRTSVDETTGAIVARNPFQEDFPDQSVFLSVLGKADALTGDRTDFLGRNRDYANPAALERPQIGGACGPGLDPCGAVQKRVTLTPGEEVEVIFLLGQGDSPAIMGEVLSRYQTAEQVHAAIAETRAFWNQSLACVEIKTPNPAMNVLVNHWLLYQVQSCRVWGRSAFYQSGGAYGFRDQLQDVMALVYSQPRLAREHLLRAASRQFEQGDVQHWWHPPQGRGVRTRFSDDFLWLALSTSHYVSTTGDAQILDERVNYLQSAPLEPGEDERYDLPASSAVSDDLCAHCVRAIEHAFRFGPHGLPLMGSGDWNDGMNKVGSLGQGESVWMAWFLAVVLRQFAPLLEARGDRDRARSYRARADTLVQTVEQTAWDGNWYLRAFFDDGSPLGSAQNDECRVDSLVQSWSIMAGADAQRTRAAMQAVDEQLVRAADRLILLFTPPFDKTSRDPGYIKGYLPGIRENGGQYTHAAAWVVQAAALQGRGGRAIELFDMLNPILLADSPAKADRYRVEPYVVAADVYSQPPHTGRGGWTWYTGSASWMYRVVLESILGISIQANRLRFSPSISPEWPEFQVILRRRNSTWRIVVKNPQRVETGVRRVSCDGREVQNAEVQLVDDAAEHIVEVEMGPVADGDRAQHEVDRIGANHDQPDRRAEERETTEGLPD